MMFRMIIFIFTVPMVLSACTSKAFKAPVTGTLSDPLIVRTYDVGTGACALVSCPLSEDAWLVDCGSSGSRKTSLKALKSDLENYKNKKNLSVAVSHADSDHLNLIPEIASDASLKAIFLGGNEGQYEDATFLRWLERQQSNGVPITFVESVEEVSEADAEAELSCGASDVSFLAANGSGTRSGNSLVTSFAYGNSNYVFTGDATGVVQDEIIRNFTFRRSETDEMYVVLVAPHHGSVTHESNSWKFAVGLRPSVVLFSSNGSRYGHPRCEALFNYALTSSLVAVQEHLITCGDSSVMRIHNTTAAAFGTADSETIQLRQRDEGSWPVVTCYDSDLLPKKGC